MPGSLPRQSGNVFFALFGAVALLGAVGASTMAIMKGPVKSMAEVTKRTVAENAMIASGKLAIMAASNLPNNGDCDSDSMIEPVPFSTTGTGPKPIGGGYLPPSIGAAKQDPWGSDYGYCVWDHSAPSGPATDRDGNCGGSTNYLKGSDVTTKLVLAVISPGPNRTYETTCADDPTYLTKPPGSDDIVLSYTYGEASTDAGGVWKIKTGDAKTAEIDKNLEVKNASDAVVMAFDQTTDTSKPSLKVDFIAKLTAARKGIALLSNVILGTNYISAAGDNEGLSVAAGGQLASSGSGAGFAALPRDGSGSTWIVYNPTGDDLRIWRTTNGDAVTINQAGQVGIARAPSYMLDVGGTVRALGPNSGGSGDALIIGNDSKFADIDIANRVGLYGLQDPTTGGIKLGTAGATIVGYNGNLGVGTSTTPAYPLDVTGGVRSSGEIISTNANQFRMVQGNYGSFFRNDGANTYLLLTASGDPYGAWNALRPFYVNDATGNVVLGNGALTVTHGGATTINTVQTTQICDTAGANCVAQGALGSGSTTTTCFSPDDPGGWMAAGSSYTYPTSTCYNNSGTCPCGSSVQKVRDIINCVGSGATAPFFGARFTRTTTTSGCSRQSCGLCGGGGGGS